MFLRNQLTYIVWDTDCSQSGCEPKAGLCRNIALTMYRYLVLRLKVSTIRPLIPLRALCYVIGRSLPYLRHLNPLTTSLAITMT